MTRSPYDYNKFADEASLEIQLLNGKLIFSATDLSNYLACPHLTLLNRRTVQGGPRPRVFPDASLEVLRQRGHEHEQYVLARLRVNDGHRVTEIYHSDRDESRLERYERLAAETVEAIRAGVDLIYQGCLFDGFWLGFPDFLRKVDLPSKLGGWSYEVIDAKLARGARAARCSRC